MPNARALKKTLILEVVKRNDEYELEVLLIYLIDFTSERNFSNATNVGRNVRPTLSSPHINQCTAIGGK